MKTKRMGILTLLLLFVLIVSPASAQAPAPQDPRAEGLSAPVFITEDEIELIRPSAEPVYFRVVLADTVIETGDTDPQSAFLARAAALLGHALQVDPGNPTAENSLMVQLSPEEARQLARLEGVLSVSPLEAQTDIFDLDGITTDESDPVIQTGDPLPVIKQVSQTLANPGDTLIYSLTVPVNTTGADLEYAISDTLPAGVTYISGSLYTEGSDTLAVYDALTGSITWQGTQPNFMNTYYVSDQASNPEYCKMPFFDGGYLDILTRYGTPTFSNIHGDGITFRLGLGTGTEFFGEVIPDKPIFTDDGLVMMTADSTYEHYGMYCPENQNLPDPLEPNGLLSLWWWDMKINYDALENKGVTAMYWTGEYPAWLVEFDDIVDWYDETRVMDLEVFTWREPDPDQGFPDILFAFDNVGGDWYDDVGDVRSTIGIENFDGTRGHTYAYNNFLPQSGDIICFDYVETGRDPVVITYAVTVDLEQVPGTVISNQASYTVNGGLPVDVQASFTVNDTPVAYSQMVATTEEVPVVVYLEASDLYPGGLLDYQFTSPYHGSLSGPVASPTYTPHLNFCGTDYFYFTVSDGVATSEIATVTVEVACVNDVPVITDIPNQTIDEGQTFTAIDLDKFVSDIETPDYLLVWTNSGNVELGVDLIDRIAVISIPHEDWFGVEMITFRATDAEGAFTEEAVIFTVNPVNDAPIAVDDDLGTEINVPLAIDESTLLTNDIDVDNAIDLVVTEADNLLGGSITQADGVIIFTPITNYIGLAGFDYTVSDTFLSDEGRVNIMITDENNTVPTSVADAYVMNEYGRLIVDAPGILGNDLDAENNVLRTVLVSPTSNGTLTVNLDGAFTYIPTPGYVGEDSFVYHVTDGILDGEDVTVTITVNELPVQDVTIPLYTGWNLVSFNLMPANTAITELLGSIAGQYTLVYAWDALTGLWQQYDPSVPPYANDLQDLTRDMGIWINMTVPASLVISGKPVEYMMMDLSPGWNLVGFPSTETSGLPGALSGWGVTQFSSVMAYHAQDVGDEWKLFNPTAPIYVNTLQAMTPGWGYWIHTDTASTWEVIYDLP